MALAGAGSELRMLHHLSPSMLGMPMSAMSAPNVRSRKRSSAPTAESAVVTSALVLENQQ